MGSQRLELGSSRDRELSLEGRGSLEASSRGVFWSGEGVKKALQGREGPWWAEDLVQRMDGSLQRDEEAPENGTTREQRVAWGEEGALDRSPGG